MAAKDVDRRFHVRALGAAETVPSHAALAQKLSIGFKLSRDQAQRIARGDVVVARNLDADTAGRLKQKLTAAGIRSRIEAANGASAVAASPSASRASDHEPVTRFIAGLGNETAGVRRSLSYRLWSLLVLFSAVVSPLLYLAFVAAGVIGILVYVDAAALPHSVGSAIVYVTPLVTLAALTAFLLRPLFMRYRPPARMALDERSAPGLFALVRRVSAATRTPKPVTIYVDGQVNASVSSAGGMLDLFRRRLTLTVGMPLVYGMSLSQLACVIAHELGHFTQPFEMLASTIVNNVNAWMARCAADDEVDPLEARLEAWRETIPWSDIALTAALWCLYAVRYLMRGLLHLNVRLTRGLSRAMELNADDHAVQLVGSAAFVDSSLSLRELMVAYQEAWGLNLAAYNENRLLENVPSAVQRLRSGYSDEVRDNIRAGIEAETSEYWHTHPADRDRIVRAEAQQVMDAPHGSAPALLLFRDAGSVAGRVTLQTYTRDYAIREAADLLLDNEQVFAIREEQDSADDALAVLFGAHDHVRMLRFDGAQAAAIDAASSRSAKAADRRGTRTVKPETLRRLAEQRAATLEAFEACRDRMNRLVVARLYLEAGLELNARDLGVETADSRTDSRTIERHLSAASAEAEQAGRRLAAFDMQYLKLLRWIEPALPLARQPRVAALIDWLKRVGTRHETIEALARTRDALAALLARRGDKAPQQLDASIARHQRLCTDALARLMDGLGPLPNLLVTASAGETVETFLSSCDVERLPGAAEPDADRVVKVAGNALKGLGILHYRCLGELAGDVVASMARAESPRPGSAERAGYAEAS